MPPNRIHFLRFLYRMSRFIVAAKLFIYGDFLKNTKKIEFFRMVCHDQSKIDGTFLRIRSKISLCGSTYPPKLGVGGPSPPRL